MQAYWLVVRVLLTPPAEAAASQKWKIIYLQVLRLSILCRKASCGVSMLAPDLSGGQTGLKTRISSLQFLL